MKDKTRANFCGYFQARPAAYYGGDNSEAHARAELENLFGGTSAEPVTETTQARLNALFGGDGKDKAS